MNANATAAQVAWWVIPLVTALLSAATTIAALTITLAQNRRSWRKERLHEAMSEVISSVAVATALIQDFEELLDKIESIERADLNVARATSQSAKEAAALERINKLRAHMEPLEKEIRTHMQNALAKSFHCGFFLIINRSVSEHVRIWYGEMLKALENPHLAFNCRTESLTLEVYLSRELGQTVTPEAMDAFDRMQVDRAREKRGNRTR